MMNLGFHCLIVLVGLLLPSGVVLEEMGTIQHGFNTSDPSANCPFRYKLRGGNGEGTLIFNATENACDYITIEFANDWSQVSQHFRLELESFTCGTATNPTDKPTLTLSTNRDLVWSCNSGEDDDSAKGLNEVIIYRKGDWGHTSVNVKVVVYSAWGFLLIRTLVAVMFILIPAVILFLIFHRRQVHLQRRALEEEAARGGGYHTYHHHHGRRYSIAVVSDLASDVPPTYEDVYETKEPPPCFCQVIAVPPTTTPTTDSSTPSSAISCNCEKKPSPS